MGEVTPDEVTDLEAAVKAFHSLPANADFAVQAKPLVAFVGQHPQGAWATSILSNLGSGYYHAGYFTRAFNSWQAAWELGRDRTDPLEKAIVDRTYGELVRMHARVGHATQLEALLAEAGARSVSGGAAEMVTGAREGLWMFKNEWGIAYLCGPMALKNLLTKLNASKATVTALDDVRSGPNGFTLAEVGDLATRVGLEHALVRRQAGEPIPVPSLVNWKVNHYAAIVEEANGRYRVKDPTFATGDLWVSKEAIDEESSGYFLVPRPGQRDLPWRLASAEEASNIYGKGFTLESQAGATGKCDHNSQAPGPTSGNDQPGMCMANAKSMLVSVNLSDRALGYRPPKGPIPDLSITYNQREAYQPAVFTYSNVSPKWALGAISFIQDDPEYPGFSLTRYRAGGGAYDYGNALPNGNYYDSLTGAFIADQQNGGVLVRYPADGPLTSYVLTLPDGSRQIFSLADGGTTFPRRVFLTQVIDPAGNAMTFTYDASLRLLRITDSTGRNTTFAYTSAFSPLLVTQVTDPMGRHADFTYDGQGRLASITDVIGLTSSFQYDASGLVRSMTTPYGTTSFVAEFNGDENFRSLETTDPMGFTDRLEFRHSAPGIPFEDPVAPLNSTNTRQGYRNTFYWDKHVYPITHTDYTQARVTHWLHNYNGQTSPIIESTKEPLENRVWYSYPLQNSYAYEGPSDKPASLARILDNGEQREELYGYNGLWNLAETTDPAGRRSVFNYFANGIDVASVQQQTDSSGTLSTTSSFTYNGQHRPVTYTDAAGQTSYLSYNAAGQITGVTNALNQATTSGYDGYGRMTSTTNANNIVQRTWTYDAYDHVVSTTDSEGYTLTYAYDALDRLTQITYPDGTTMRYGYDRLDLVSVTDRQNRTTTYGFDANRRMVSMRNPLAQTTTFGYFRNGTLASITDPRGNTTQWMIDIQSRPTSKRYANGATETYAYEATTSRLRSVTDALGQTKNFAYTIDDRLAAISYASPQRPTPSVSFAYDAYFPLLVSMVDGIGTTTWQYRPLGALGALQIATENGPFNNDVLTYQYDGLGRVTSNQATGETFGYDALGRLSSHGTALGSFVLGYLGQTDQLTSRIMSGGLGTQWSYLGNLNDRRLSGVTNSGAARSYAFATTSMNAITQATERIGATASRTWNYGYDGLDRLTSATPGGTGYTYGYDAASNITNLSGSAASYDAANQVVNLAGRAYSYDANGNVLNDGQRAYRWDAEDRLVQATYTSQARGTTFRYDGLGRRLSSKTAQGLETRYLWCGGRICQSRDGNDTPTKLYFVEGVRPAGIAGYVYGIDQLGTVRDQTAISGGAITSFDYDPYGSLTRQTGPAASELGFAGLFGDGASNLLMANHRAYDPPSARWASKDPIREFGGDNLYSYVGGNPLSLVDPDGLIPLPIITGLIGAGAGAIGNVIGQLALSKCKPFNWTDLAVATGGGFLAGAIAPYIPGGIFGAATWGGISNVGQYAAGSAIKSEGMTMSNVAINFATGVVGGAAGGAVGRASPWPYSGTAASRAMVDASNNAANVRLNTATSNLIRNLGGGILGNAPATDLCGCMTR